MGGFYRRISFDNIQYSSERDQTHSMVVLFSTCAACALWTLISERCVEKIIEDIPLTISAWNIKPTLGSGWL